MVRQFVKEAVAVSALKGAVGGGLFGAGVGAGTGALATEPGERGKGALRGALIGGGTGVVGGGLLGAGNKIMDTRLRRVLGEESPDVLKRYDDAAKNFDSMRGTGASDGDYKKAFDELIDSQAERIGREVEIGNKGATPGELALRYGGHTLGAGGALLAAPAIAQTLGDRDSMKKRASAYQAEGFAHELALIQLQKEAGLRDLAAKAKGAFKKDTDARRAQMYSQQ